jgi:hypothetical protein
MVKLLGARSTSGAFASWTACWFASENERLSGSAKPTGGTLDEGSGVPTTPMYVPLKLFPDESIAVVPEASSSL